jgi:hypothetical protein
LTVSVLDKLKNNWIKTLEKTEARIKNGQFRDTSNIGHNIQKERQAKQKTPYKKLNWLRWLGNL